MPRRAKLLYALQQIDTRLAVRQRRYRQVQANLGESAALRQARDVRQAAQDELSHQRATLRDRELEAASVIEKLRANEERLYSGRVTNPRELGDLQQENEYLKRRRTDLEDKQLEAMMGAEGATTRAAVANEQYIVAEAMWREENAELSQEYDTLRHDLARLLAQRKSVLKRISAKDLDEYNALRRLRKGVAVVAVKEDMCRACNVQVPQRDLLRARETDDFFYCSGCERILYVPEEE
jgi:predicted  nucleic acid-binding Zn-ribbon protein